MMASTGCVLASFSSQARGIKFYDVPSDFICVGGQFSCRLESTNLWDSDCIALVVGASSQLGHLAQEASHYLAPLLRAGFQASG